MAKVQKAAKSNQVKATDYRHAGKKRTNIPPAKIAAEGKVPSVPKARYYYNPHLPPVLRFDPTGEADGVKELVYESAKRPLRPEEVMKVAEAVEHYGPWLEWAGKREQHEKRYFEVDPVALHIHERVSTQAIVRAAMREDVQRDLFADPQLPYQKEIQFYQHDIDWANRLILGDSLQVMSSLARRESLAGKVQMIYIDPPYGIKFASNFQPELGKRDVKDRDSDMTREPETVMAYRDTWHLGVHSYLTYLRDRFAVANDLLTTTGSLFVQISDDHLHSVRNVLDEVFGVSNFVRIIPFKKTGYLASTVTASNYDFLLWYAKDKVQMNFNSLFIDKKDGGSFLGQRLFIENNDYLRRSPDEEELAQFPYLTHHRFLRSKALQGSGISGNTEPYDYCGTRYSPAAHKHWLTTTDGLGRLDKANRLMPAGNSLEFAWYFDDFPVTNLPVVWEDTVVSGFGRKQQFVVETNPLVVQRCVLMTTQVGDIILDPTCGSGTTAYVAERWGRRWITIDSSRVAVTLARQRLLVEKYEYFKLRDQGQRLAGGFVYKAVPHITLKSIVNNANLDPIFEKHEPILLEALEDCNRALQQVTDDVRGKLLSELLQKQKTKGKRAITDADRRRWVVPKKGERWQQWEVPFDTDPNWPKALQDAVTAYRKAWRAKMEEVNACIAANAEQEELVDQPEIVNGVVRVSGPFTVEGVRPEELSLGEDGLVDATSNESEDTSGEVEVTNINAYLTRMVQHLRTDGLTFIGNQRKKFARLEPVFETQTGSIIHAEGVWDGGDPNGPNTVAVGFGPQHGPVTALQVEELVRAAKRYDELVVAGFSFDAEATEVIQARSHPKLRIHQAYIRPDINPAMEGLLKENGNSQLFTVFGQPEVELDRAEDGEWVVKLVGVDIYDPVENTVRSSGAEKVAAWFLDSDYDGRCFCITQAFFPDQDAWEKIAKALGSSADPEAFEKFDGTESLPFKTGKYKRIAVKVIDPRGNEVMAVRQLED